MTLNEVYQYSKTCENSCRVITLKDIKRKLDRAYYELTKRPSQIIRDLQDKVFYD